MRYIVGVSSWTWMMQRHLDFRRISPGNRRWFSAHLYQWRKSIGQTTAHPEHPKSIQSISVQILDLWTIYGWILNDTELGSTLSLFVEEDPSNVPCHLEPQSSSRSGSRGRSKTLSIFKALNHLWNNHKPYDVPGDQVQFWELHLVNHLLKFGALRRLGVCAFISKN